ncbi:MAG: YlmC/YmxH family sporulation protein [Clostridiales bacterium]|nr:YlmC/YmxH family sporulation protein [Clostridiales bacterium]
MEISYTDLRAKEVVNLQNGARMGKIIDMIIDSNGKNVLGLVVPGVRKLFKASEDIFIPWRNITKIGNDVILVSLDAHCLTNVTKSQDMNLEGIPCEKDLSDDYL